MARYPSGVSYSFGPGLTPAVKLLIITNVALFVLNLIVGDMMTLRLGLSPQAVFEQLALWQPFTYMFLHSTSGVGHILINMLALAYLDVSHTWPGARVMVGTGGGRPVPAIVVSTPFFDPAGLRLRGTTEYSPTSRAAASLM